MTAVRDEGFHLLDIPDVVLVPEAFHRFTRLRIAPVRQFSIAMNGVVPASLQLAADRRLARAGKAFDQVVPLAHASRIVIRRDEATILVRPLPSAILTW